MRRGLLVSDLGLTEQQEWSILCVLYQCSSVTLHQVLLIKPVLVLKCVCIRGITV